MLWLFRFFYAWPLPALHALGGVLGWGVWAFSPGYRRRFRSNCAQADVPFLLAKPAIAEAGRFVAELPHLWLRPFDASCLTNVQGQRQVQVLGTDVAEQAFAKGKGVIFFGAHCGCFELAPQVLAEVFGPQHGPLTAIYRPARQPSLAAVELATRQRPFVTLLPASLSAIKAMHKALKAGRAVGLLADQVPPEGLGIWAPFFGRPAYTMTLAARLALQNGAALVPVTCERLPKGRGYIVTIRPAIDLPADTDLLAAVTRISQTIESIVLSQPGQYLWGYGRYKKPRQETVKKDVI